MSNGKKRPVIIWTPGGDATLQESRDGQLILSCFGWALDRAELQEFCTKYGIEFVVYVPKEAEEFAPA
jgi:hypothetical protein